MGRKLSDKYNEFDEGINYLEVQEDFEKNKFRLKGKEKMPGNDTSADPWPGYLSLLGMVAAIALFTFLFRSCLGV